MNKKFLLTSLLILSMSVAAGCVTTELTKQQSLCYKLRLEKVYHQSNSNNIEAGWLTTTQKEKFQQLYDENHCDTAV